MAFIAPPYQIKDGQSGDDAYFSNYEDLAVHSLMLKDEPRTYAYKTFIENNKHLIKDKVVIDVGAGTGILSLFAAKAGAKKVYAVEASGLTSVCKQIVKDNDFDGVIEVVQGRVEEVELPAGVVADVIVSEWMGIYLLHESMLNSLIVARDRWLGPDGVILPSTASIYFCPVTMPDYVKSNFDYWNDVYGFDFSSVVPHAKKAALTQPLVTVIESKHCIAEPELLSSLDLQFVTADDIKHIHGAFNFTFTKHSVLHGFACWFDVEFNGEHSSTLSTGPYHAPTHWKQTVIMLPEAYLVNKGGSIECELTMTQDKDNPRTYGICVAVPEDDTEEDDEEESNDIKDIVVKAYEAEHEES